MSGRKLKARSHEFLGVDQKAWLGQEVGGYGDEATSGLVPADTSAVDFISCDVKFDIPREDSPSRSGRSVVARLSGKKSVEVKVESLIIPGNPVAGKPSLPPMHPLILSAFGDVDLSNPAEIKYKLSRFNGNSARILEEATHYSRLAVGVIADKITFSLPGDGKAQMSMEGFAQDAYIAGVSHIATANALADNTLEVEAGHGFRYEVGSYVDVINGTDGNTVIASKRKVLAVVGDVIEVDGAAIVTSVGDYVMGHAPANYQPITSEYALLGLKGAFNVAGFPLGHCELISAEIGLSNNYTKKDFVYGTDKICGFLPDKRREVSVKIEVLLNKDTLSFYMRNKQFVAEELTITLEPQRIPGPAFSSSAGRTFEFHFPKVEFNIPAIENPADSYVTLSLEGIALAPSANQLDEEFTLTIK